jgi:hypothetical protein
MERIERFHAVCCFDRFQTRGTEGEAKHFAIQFNVVDDEDLHSLAEAEFTKMRLMQSVVKCPAGDFWRWTE